MNYYISDLHLLHKNCIRFDERPFEGLEEMHETILTNWNRKVTDSDTVFILGDVAMYGFIQILEEAGAEEGKSD